MQGGLGCMALQQAVQWRRGEGRGVLVCVLCRCSVLARVAVRVLVALCVFCVCSVCVLCVFGRRGESV